MPFIDNSGKMSQLIIWTVLNFLFVFFYQQEETYTCKQGKIPYGYIYLLNMKTNYILSNTLLLLKHFYNKKSLIAIKKLQDFFNCNFFSRIVYILSF